ncbi:MAG: hypothetical protein HYV97_19960 [Bdellovibrio sp.]|nr:hypothetical protein [Bdellovibrio sp.]
MLSTMHFAVLLFILFGAEAIWADSWVYQTKENKLRGIILTKYLDENGLEHFRVGHFLNAKAIEKESITKSEFVYLIEYGERLKKDLGLAPNDIDCKKGLQVTQNNSIRICYHLDDNARKDFFEWHDYIEKFILGKEEKDNLILKRHLKKP